MYMTSVCFLFIKVSDSLELVHLVLSLSPLLKVVTDYILSPELFYKRLRLDQY